MHNISRTLQNIAVSIIGKACDPKVIKLWDHYITKGGFSLDDFRDYLLKSPEFSTHAESSYVTKAEAIENAPAFATFWKIFGPKSKEWINQGVDHVIHDFLASTPEFAAKYGKIVADVFAYETNGTISPAEQSFYLGKFASNANYDVVTLSADISNGLHVGHGQLEEIQNDVFRGEGGGINGINGINGGNGSGANGINGGNGANDTAGTLFDVEKLEAFESVFRRPMFVQEYFKYCTAVKSKSWLELFNEHNDLFNRMRTIFETYTGKTISEYYYVNRFLFSVEDLDFFEHIVDDIVTSPEYKNGMLKVLCERYLSMFDVAMSEIDMEYIFQIVKNQKLDIVNEKIATILTDLKDETDKIIGAIFKVFANVLDRPPDMNEIEQYVTYYRNGGLDPDLEKILMRTLEFHDNIKKRIRAEYLAVKGKDVLPSILFDILNRIIVKIDELAMGTINATIKELIV